MQKLITIFHFFLIIFIASCSQPKAPVVNRGSAVYGRSSFVNKQKNTKATTGKSAKNVSAKSNNNSTSIVVANGENVYSVAKKYNVSLRDLINENNLLAPYNLKVGDKINLPSSQYHSVLAGDTLYSISRKYEMNVNNLIAINNLKKPYAVQVGQKLKVTNSPTNSSVANQKTDLAKPEKIAQETPKKISDKPLDLTVENKNNRFAWPIKGAIISKFGAKPGGLFNDGVNIKAKNGDNVKAAEDGVVAYVGNELRGYGNLIIIKHSGGWISAYAHLDKTKIKRGSKVKKGQSIATVGSSGNVKSPQLYFGLRKGREAVNPQTYL